MNNLLTRTFFLHPHKEKGSNHWKLPPRIQCSHYSVPEQLEKRTQDGRFDHKTLGHWADLDVVLSDISFFFVHYVDCRGLYRPRGLSSPLLGTRPRGLIVPWPTYVPVSKMPKGRPKRKPCMGLYVLCLQLFSLLSYFFILVTICSESMWALLVFNILLQCCKNCIFYLHDFPVPQPCPDPDVIGKIQCETTIALGILGFFLSFMQINMIHAF
jgi:hypothetical protein